MESSFDSPTAIFRQKSRNCSLSIRKWLKNKIVFSNNLARKSSTECRKGFAQCARMRKNIWPFSKKFLIMIIWTHQKQFSQRCRKTFATGPKFLTHFWKRIAHTQFFQQIIFLPSFLVETYFSVLAILLEVFWQKTEKVCTLNENHKKIHFSRKSSLNCSSGHVVYCFHHRKVFVRCPKVTEKSFFCRKVFLKSYLLRHINQFFQPCRKKFEGKSIFFQS